MNIYSITYKTKTKKGEIRDKRDANFSLKLRNNILSMRNLFMKDIFIKEAYWKLFISSVSIDQCIV